LSSEKFSGDIYTYIYIHTYIYIYLEGFVNQAYVEGSISNCMINVSEVDVEL